MTKRPIEPRPLSKRIKKKTKKELENQAPTSPQTPVNKSTPSHHAAQNYPQHKLEFPVSTEQPRWDSIAKAEQTEREPVSCESQGAKTKECDFVSWLCLCEGACVCDTTTNSNDECTVDNGKTGQCSQSISPVNVEHERIPVKEQDWNGHPDLPSLDNVDWFGGLSDDREIGGWIRDIDMDLLI